MAEADARLVQQAGHGARAGPSASANEEHFHASKLHAAVYIRTVQV